MSNCLESKAGAAIDRENNIEHTNSIYGSGGYEI